MKIYILRKSLSNLKTPIERKEYDTKATTIEEFISEMVERNYRLRPIDDTLDYCIQTSLDDFQDGCIYIVNATKNARYTQLNDALGLCEMIV